MELEIKLCLTMKMLFKVNAAIVFSPVFMF